MADPLVDLWMDILEGPLMDLQVNILENFLLAM